MASFGHVPETLKHGEYEKEGIEMVKDALVTAMDIYFDDLRAVPLPSPDSLARRMDLMLSEINWLLSLDHKTKVDTPAQALLSLSPRFELSVA